MARKLYRESAGGLQRIKTVAEAKNVGFCQQITKLRQGQFTLITAKLLGTHPQDQDHTISAGRTVLRSFRHKMACDEIKGTLCPNSVLALGIRQGLIREGESFGQTPLSHDKQVIISGCQVGTAHIDYSRGDICLPRHAIDSCVHMFYLCLP